MQKCEPIMRSVRVRVKLGAVTGLIAMDLYHGDTQGGARNPNGLKKEDFPGFYLTPHYAYAFMFTNEYATIPSGSVTMYRLKRGAKVVNEDFLTDTIDWQETAGLGDIPYSEAVAIHAKQMGFDAIHRHRGSYLEGNRWRRPHEVIVLNSSMIEKIAEMNEE